MKRFAFRLDRLLQLRALAEREQARALALALREEERRRAAVRLSEAELAQARAQFAVTPRELSQAGTLQNLELTVLALAERVNSLSREHEESLERVESERHQFEQARMARRVIERLREQRREAWTGEVARWEQRVADETAIQRASGRPQETG